MRRRSHNPKRQIRTGVDEIGLNDLAERVHYVGSPYHKRKHGDFTLIPPAQPRADATLCDGANVFEHRVALALLKQGVRSGLISLQQRGDFPQNVWAMTKEGIALEAQLDNQQLGTYHGYPLVSSDPIAAEVAKRWKEVSNR